MSRTGVNLVFLGPPGAGKGTQAKRFAEDRGLAHVSTGDLFRQNLKEETPVGLQAKGYMERGLLVPDDVVCTMVRNRLEEPDAESGFILDGFPRTVPQAESLRGDLERLQSPLSAIINFEIPEDRLMERLTGRLTCKSCGAMFHRSFRPPAKAGVCDACGAEALYTRDDDTPEAVKKRLEEYAAKTAPLVAWYREQGLVRSVDASGPIEEVQGAIESALEGR